MKNGGRASDFLLLRVDGEVQGFCRLTALTARSIEHAYRAFLPTFPDEVILRGGGARNSTLIAMLKERLTPAIVTTSDEYGLGIEAKEAIAFAVLAY